MADQIKVKRTIKDSVFTDGIYNDLGFIKGNNLMILVEAQYLDGQYHYQSSGISCKFLPQILFGE